MMKVSIRKKQQIFIDARPRRLVRAIFYKTIHFYLQKLAIVDIQSEPANILDELRNRFPKTEILYFQTDVTLKDELETTFKEVRETFESIDILINAAGIFNDRDVELTFKVNVVGLFNIKLIELMSHLNSVFLYEVWYDQRNNVWCRANEQGKKKKCSGWHHN